MKEQLEAIFVNQLNELRDTAFHEILKCRNEKTDLRNELRAVQKGEDSERTNAAPPTYLGLSKVSAKKNTVNELQPTVYQDAVLNLK